jgi:ubiquinone/menaquinone biosynthesis C-methylase UbiE
MTDSVRKFWDDQAQTFKESDLATAPDHHYRTMEIERILGHLRDGQRILDVGCGNGYSTIRFAERLPGSTFVGVDYSAPMIDYANEALKKSGVGGRIRFMEGDVLDLSNVAGEFDAVVSERCIINLRDWTQQQRAILNMAAKLKPAGRLILTENTQEGLASLNALRAEFGLHPIAVRWHNFYLPQTELEEWLPRHFLVEAVENIGNLYYILSRVLYARLAKNEGQEPDYDHPINAIASKLPSLDRYNYSPNFVYVLTPRSHDEAQAEAELSDAYQEQLRAEINSPGGDPTFEIFFNADTCWAQKRWPSGQLEAISVDEAMAEYNKQTAR